MASALYLAFGVIQLALAVAGASFARRSGSKLAWLVVLPVAALVYDNLAVAAGTVIGFSPLLATLTLPRFVGHALLTPAWIVGSLELARLAGVKAAENRLARVGSWALYAAMVALGSWASLVLLDLQPSTRDGLIYYTNGGGLPGPPIPAIVMVLVTLGWGVAIARQAKWPFVAIGAAVMFVAAAMPTSVVGFIPSNTGEVVLSTAMVLTLGRFAPSDVGASRMPD